MNEPTQWTSAVSKASWTLLLVAVVSFVAWHLMRQLLPALVVLGVLLFVYRVAIGYRRNRW